MAAVNLKSLIGGCVLFFLIMTSAPAAARTSLVALPIRQDTVIKLDSRGTALVQEKRTLLLQKGINNIDFSWQNVMIDPDSIQFTPLQHSDSIVVLSVSYPPGESTLIWNIHSPNDVQEEIMISYLLANVDGMTAYRAIADVQEKTLDLNTYLVLRNFSGEDFSRVAVSLSGSKPHTTGIDHLETKRMLVSQQVDIPIKKTYTWDALTMPHDPQKLKTAVGIPVTYELSNTETSNLGRAPLLNGKVRIFQDDRKDSTIFLGEDICTFTPVGDKADLYIGDSRDIVVTRKVMDSKQSNIRRNKKGKIQAYDETYAVQVTAENLKDKPVVLSVIETIDGHWQPESMSMEYQQPDHKTLRFDIRLAANQKRTLQLKYKVLNIFSGTFSRHNRESN